MNTESKGRAWYGKIYRKLETILVEVDNLASQSKASLSSSDPPGLVSVRDEPKKLTEDHCPRTELSSCNRKATTSLCRNDPKSSHFTHCSPVIAFNQDEDFDDAPLDTIELYDMTFREDPSDFDDNLLYAARDRTRQLRSFKTKIKDALTSKRRREKEYEHLAIWFGDADMGCDVMNTKKHATASPDPTSSESNVPFASEDSEWELL